MADSKDQTTYGSCDGPDSMYVKLISSDGYEFVIKREHALLSGTIKGMFSGPGAWAESKSNLINFREIRGPVLERVCEYLAYKAKYHECPVQIPEFPIDVDMCLELMMAANFLAC